MDIKLKSGRKINLFKQKKILYGMLVQRLCHNSNFPLFSTAMKILMNETERNSDRGAS